MKKSLFILAAATAVAFAACNGGNEEGSYTAAQADSIAKVKADSIAAAMKIENDSAIAAQAQRTADSLRVIDSILASTKQTTTTTTTVVKKGGNKGTSSTTTKKETKVEPKPVDKTDPSYRPGAKNSSSNSPEGQKETPKSVSDRPGAK